MSYFYALTVLGIINIAAWFMWFAQQNTMIDRMDTEHCLITQQWLEVGRAPPPSFLKASVSSHFRYELQDNAEQPGLCFAQ